MGLVFPTVPVPGCACGGRWLGLSRRPLSRLLPCLDCDQCLICSKVLVVQVINVLDLSPVEGAVKLDHLPHAPPARQVALNQLPLSVHVDQFIHLAADLHSSSERVGDTLSLRLLSLSSRTALRRRDGRPLLVWVFSDSPQSAVVFLCSMAPLRFAYPTLADVSLSSHVYPSDVFTGSTPTSTLGLTVWVTSRSISDLRVPHIPLGAILASCPSENAISISASRNRLVAPRGKRTNSKTASMAGVPPLLIVPWATLVISHCTM